MVVTVGTFNLNNLFSRFNFSAQVSEDPGQPSGGVTLTFAEGSFDVRSFFGRLIKEKDAASTTRIARRIREVMNADVLAVQEVEHIELLRKFNRDYLGSMYPHQVLVEGNDGRLIDVGVLSKLPIGPIVSHQTATHSSDRSKRVFSRDLLQVTVLDSSGDKLFNLYNTHLKSHYVPANAADPVAEAARSNERRRRQAETIGAILSKMERPNSKFVLAGDMNDPPHSPDLAGMLISDGVPLVNALLDPIETRPAKAETTGQGPGPTGPAWTHRYNPPGPELPRYELLDQIWVSQRLAASVISATIDRRTRHGGDGSDHDPAWIELDL